MKPRGAVVGRCNGNWKFRQQYTRGRSIMKTFIFVLGLSTLISAPAFAQNSNHAYHADGYGFFSYNAPQGASFTADAIKLLR